MWKGLISHYCFKKQDRRLYTLTLKKFLNLCMCSFIHSFLERIVVKHLQGVYSVPRILTQLYFHEKTDHETNVSDYDPFPHHCSLTLLIFVQFLTYANLFPLWRLFHNVLSMCLPLYYKFYKFWEARDHDAI